MRFCSVVACLCSSRSLLPPFHFHVHPFTSPRLSQRRFVCSSIRNGSPTLVMPSRFTLQFPIPIHYHCRFLHATPTPTPPSVRMYVYLLFTIPLPHPRHPSSSLSHSPSSSSPPSSSVCYVPSHVLACFTLRLYALQIPMSYVLRSAFSFHFIP